MLRDYQQTCISGVLDKLSDADSTLAVMPTGTGKTHCFASIIANWPRDKGRILVLGHRGELIWQAKNKIDMHLSSVGEYIGADIEMGNLTSVSEYGYMHESRVVVATVQSMHERRLKRFKPTDFGLIVVDEAHHAVKKNKQYYNVIKYFMEGGLKVLGVTATPDRSDEEALGSVFNTVAFHYGIGDAIRDGWLTPVHQEMVHVQGLDLSKVSANAGDLAAGQLNDILKDEEMCHKVVSPTLDIVGDKKTLVFAAGVAQAEMICEIFNRHKAGSAVTVSGACGSDERKEMLRRYSEGDYQFMCNCNVFTEGYDEPTIECVVMARPTKSRMLYAQMAGRGTRILPDVIEGLGTPPDGYDVVVEDGFWRIADPEQRKQAIANCPKSNVLLIDFVGNSGKHKLVYSGDILGGQYSDEVVELANENMKEYDGPVDVNEALQEAKKTIEEEKRKAKQKIIIEAKYKRRSIDPFDVFDITEKREPGWFKGKKPTDKMLAMLKRNKVPLFYNASQWWIGEKGKKNAKPLTFYRAKTIIQEISDRRSSGLCTYSQAKLLRRFGEDPNIGFTEASKVIDEIAKRGWKPRPDAEI